MMDTYNAFAPSQSEVDSFKEKLENSKAEQKNLFLIIFQVWKFEFAQNFRLKFQFFINYFILAIYCNYF